MDSDGPKAFRNPLALHQQGCDLGKREVVLGNLCHLILRNQGVFSRFMGGVVLMCSVFPQELADTMDFQS
jgi:hypothetical protein